MALFEVSLHTWCLVSVIGATITALACGTGYAFSAWGPAFAEKMVLSATETNLIGASGNLGMYGAGIPLGMLVDYRGPRTGSAVGCIAMGLGYFALYRVYLGGPGSMPLPLICFFTFVAGCGGSAGFGGAIKTAALNYPKNRGTATAFPISAFGLSAFFFSLISSVALPGDTASFLLVLSLGTFSLIAIPIPFIHVPKSSTGYSAISNEANEVSQGGRSPRHRKHDASSVIGMRDQSISHRDSLEASRANEPTSLEMQELNKLDTEDLAEDALEAREVLGGEKDQSAHNSLYADVRGLALLRYTEFYQLLTIIGVLTGIGLMTINNIGNDAQALWSHWDENTPLTWIRQRQSMHVSIISLASFAGRLCSGIGSDIIVEKLHMSRLWCFVLSSVLFCLAQFCALTLNNPNFLWVLSGLSGLAYGFLFGVGPSCVAETFGPDGLSQNWGTFTLSPIIFANIYNLMYGRIFDAHSDIKDTGHRECSEGRGCYRDAYLVTMASSIVATGFCLWTIRHAKSVREKMARDTDEDHLA